MVVFRGCLHRTPKRFLWRIGFDPYVAIIEDERPEGGREGLEIIGVRGAARLITCVAGMGQRGEGPGTGGDIISAA